jgi:hypothetical protein
MAPARSNVDRRGELTLLACWGSNREIINAECCNGDLFGLRYASDNARDGRTSGWNTLLPHGRMRNLLFQPGT